MRKCIIFTVNKKYLFIGSILILLIALLLFTNLSVQSLSPNTKYTVVIDAGHGGIDGGSVGKVSGISEATLNLDYAKCLQNYMQDFGFNVIMTRTTDSGLYNPFAQNKKKDDMQKRKEIVENSNADFVISIHMNSFNGSAQGAQVFYGENDEPSQFLATKIQKYFVKYLNHAKQDSKVGDYYILNAIKSPSVLVECGYLSNAKEEALLLTEDYKKEVCYSILLGVLEYLQ
ncbi:MAG: N-acetylmuramoyl-L-alanine amidase [Clostridiales bacterium]|nr:N-acetylmuramoyl-L-alanine amidase [Clostridiales bacterium]